MKEIGPYLPVIKGVIWAVAILLTGFWLSKMANRLIVKLFNKRKLDQALGKFVGNLARYTVIAATFIAALGEVGVETTSLVAIFASAGLAVGLALQGTLSNFSSGVLLLFFRPFDLGDRITAGGETGSVEDIGLFATTMVTLDNHTIIVPNSQILGGSIKNFTTRGHLRGAIDVGVAYGLDVEKVIPVLQKAAERAELTMDDPAPAVAFVGLGASSLDFRVFAWATPDDFIPMQHNVRMAIYQDLEAAGIEIPFSQIVVHQAPAEAA